MSILSSSFRAKKMDKKGRGRFGRERERVLLLLLLLFPILDLRDDEDIKSKLTV